MAGKKGLSGPPGNMNNCSNPWRAFWRRKALRPEDRWILPTVERYPQGLLSDKPDASEAERRCVEVAAISRGCIMLLLSEIAKSGFIKNGEISTAAKELPRFLAIERQALQTLGLERRAKTVMQLNEYIETKKQQDGQSGSECP